MAPVALPAQPSTASELTLEQFHQLLSVPVSNPKQKTPPAPPDYRAADQAFLELLQAQARVAAARQSEDRLSGWSRAIKARVEAQNAPAIDLDMIRFAEAQASANTAVSEAERQRAAAAVNKLIGRPPDAPITASAARGSAGEKGEANMNSGDASSTARIESDLLPQGRDLLAKMYQNYMFGGLALSTLLWQEQQLYQAELNYRLWVARSAVVPSAAVARGAP